MPEHELITKARVANHPAMVDYDERNEREKWRVLIYLCLEQDKPIPVPDQGWTTWEMLIVVGMLIWASEEKCADTDQLAEVQADVDELATMTKIVHDSLGYAEDDRTFAEAVVECGDWAGMVPKDPDGKRPVLWMGRLAEKLDGVTDRQARRAIVAKEAQKADAAVGRIHRSGDLHADLGEAHALGLYYDAIAEEVRDNQPRPKS